MVYSYYLEYWSFDSGTNKQDMVDCEEQSMLNKRSLRWSPSPDTALTARATLSYAMAMLPMANSSIAAVPADGKVVRIPLPTPIHKRAARRYCMPIKNAAVCVNSHEPSAPRVQPPQVESKNSKSATSFLD